MLGFYVFGEMQEYGRIGQLGIELVVIEYEFQVVVEILVWFDVMCMFGQYDVECILIGEYQFLVMLYDGLYYLCGDVIGDLVGDVDVKYVGIEVLIGWKLQCGVVVMYGSFQMVVDYGYYIVVQVQSLQIGDVVGVEDVGIQVQDFVCCVFEYFWNQQVCEDGW